MTYTDYTTYIVRDDDSAHIPLDAGNIDYRTYLAWVAAGNTATPAPKPSAVPLEVSDKQFFQAAAQLGVITQAEAIAFITVHTLPAALAAAIATLSPADQFAATMAICGARNFQRNDPILGKLSTAMGQTSDEVDALFTLAATL